LKTRVHGAVGDAANVGDRKPPAFERPLTNADRFFGKDCSWNQFVAVGKRNLRQPASGVALLRPDAASGLLWLGGVDGVDTVGVVLVMMSDIDGSAPV
jgi:hypothetical protein